MPLVFSPISEAVLESAPKSLLPKHAFVMRQLGDPPPLDQEMTQIVSDVLKSRGIQTTDAGGSTGSKDYLDRIVGLIRSTGITVAVFSHQTRPTAMANISLELGFAAMCGKPIIMVKSAEATTPSDLQRTDWISYEPAKRQEFEKSLRQAADVIVELVEYEDSLLNVALEARSPDCAVAFERANKGFLLSGEKRFINAARKILERLKNVVGDTAIADLERLRGEVGTFIDQAEKAVK